MKIHKYLVFPSIEAAIQFLDQLHTAMQNKEIWTDANLHPFDKRALVPWNDDYLNQYDHLITPIEKISQDEALDQGFLFGRLRGPFAHARAKLEEAQLLQSALVEASSIPNFPVYRALFFGFLSATYALKEALRKSCNRLGNQAETWFEDQFQKLKSDPLVWAFFQLNNKNKHEPDELPLQSYMQMRSSHVNSGPPGVQLLISNEGIIGLLHAGTARERVVSLAGVADIDWQVIIDMPNCGICGAATPMTEQVLKFYEQLVFEARRSHGREPNLTP